MGVNFSRTSLGYLGPRHILRACGLTTHHIPFCFRSATQSELSDSRISRASLEEFCMGRPSSHKKTWVFGERRIPVGLSPCVEVSLSGCSPNISSRESGRHGNFGNHSCRATNDFTRHKIASKYWICHPLYPVMVWVSRALFNSRFWVLALPKSGVVVVLSSNISIGVKVVLDLFFFGGGCGICRRSDHVRVWDACDLITPFLMYRICHPA